MSATILTFVGLLLVADIDAAAQDMIVNTDVNLTWRLSLCAGAHKVQDAATLSNNEHPACAAMTTGYVFRVENNATVYFLQRIGRTGELTTLTVEPSASWIGWADVTCSMATGAAAATFGYWEDTIASAAIMMSIVARAIHSLILQRRMKKGWKGMPEPGVKSDLLVLMSRDRWIRIQGATDDVKAITSGAWLEGMTPFESCASTTATLLLYLNVGLMASMSWHAQLVMLGLIVATTLLTKYANERSQEFSLYGSRMTIGSRKKYSRRLDMARDLIEEVRRDDWCEKMGIILTSRTHSKTDPYSDGKSSGPAHM